MQNWYNCDIKNIGSYLGGGGSRGAQNMHMNVHTNPNTTGSYKQKIFGKIEFLLFFLRSAVIVCCFPNKTLQWVLT